jgi:hypothetical protein
VRWPPAWELVREPQLSRCEILLLEACSWGTGIFPEARVWGTSAVGSRYQVSGDSNRLRTLVCVCVCVIVICKSGQ